MPACFHIGNLYLFPYRLDISKKTGQNWRSAGVIPLHMQEYQLYSQDSSLLITQEYPFCFLVNMLLVSHAASRLTLHVPSPPVHLRGDIAFTADAPWTRTLLSSRKVLHDQHGVQVMKCSLLDVGACTFMLDGEFGSS